MSGCPTLWSGLRLLHNHTLAHLNTWGQTQTPQGPSRPRTETPGARANSHANRAASWVHRHAVSASLSGSLGFTSAPNRLETKCLLCVPSCQHMLDMTFAISHPTAPCPVRFKVDRQGSYSTETHRDLCQCGKQEDGVPDWGQPQSASQAHHAPKGALLHTPRPLPRPHSSTHPGSGASLMNADNPEGGRSHFS